MKISKRFVKAFGYSSIGIVDGIEFYYNPEYQLFLKEDKSKFDNKSYRTNVLIPCDYPEEIKQIGSLEDKLRTNPCLSRIGRVFKL
jgi:type II restriction/modification system DNA methylase subunit YeeA